jgi:hypothetical protein
VPQDARERPPAIPLEGLNVVLRELTRSAANWSEADDAVLRAFGTDPAKRTEAARQLGRSREAIDGRLRKLGLLQPRRGARPSSPGR